MEIGSTVFLAIAIGITVLTINTEQKAAYFDGKS